MRNLFPTLESLEFWLKVKNLTLEIRREIQLHMGCMWDLRFGTWASNSNFPKIFWFKLLIKSTNIFLNFELCNDTNLIDDNQKLRISFLLITARDVSSLL